MDMAHIHKKSTSACIWGYGCALKPKIEPVPVSVSVIYVCACVVSLPLSLFLCQIKYYVHWCLHKLKRCLGLNISQNRFMGLNYLRAETAELAAFAFVALLPLLIVLFLLFCFTRKR
jgi:hypothetical protein